jgi:hypothetical protein
VSSALSVRDKWFRFLDGEDVGPMVSPLCDDWSLDEPYRWPYDGPDPFPPGSSYHTLSQQMAMAGICGWDPTFLAAVPFQPANVDARPIVKTMSIDGGERVEQCIHTPSGDLTHVQEVKTSRRIVKDWLTTEEDYRRAIWLTEQQLDYDEDLAVEEGRRIREGVGDRGIVGTWYGPPIANLLNHDEMFYHMADWPERFEELHQVTYELVLKKVDTLRKAGFDYLFYCVSGTEWISPSLFRRYILESTRAIFARWRELGGFVLWHSCGQLKRFVEEGFYNDLGPEILETLSEPPVGDLPSLHWARKRLRDDITTKGNIPLGVLLNGTEDEVRGEVRRVKRETAGYRHIIGMSDDVFHNTPLHNCLALVDEARKN